MIKSKSIENKQNNEKESDEARYNLLSFFSLLLKIDRRVNPQRYKLKRKDLFKLVK